MSTVPMQRVCPERVQNTSDKQQTMQTNLAPCFHIKSTGSHEVLHHGQLTLVGCPVQGCVSSNIRVKEVALYLGCKVLSNGKMAFHGTQEKGISSSLKWMIRQAHNRSQPIHTCMVHRRRFNAPLSNTKVRTAYVLLYTPRTYVHYKYITTWQYSIFKSSTDIWFPWHHWPSFDRLWDLHIFSGMTCITSWSYIYQSFFCSIPFHYCCTSERTLNAQLVTVNEDVVEKSCSKGVSRSKTFRPRGYFTHQEMVTVTHHIFHILINVLSYIPYIQCVGRVQGNLSIKDMLNKRSRTPPYIQES